MGGIFLAYFCGLGIDQAQQAIYALQTAQRINTKTLCDLLEYQVNEMEFNFFFAIIFLHCR
jgi:hypothetical protein